MVCSILLITVRNSEKKYKALQSKVADLYPPICMNYAHSYSNYVMCMWYISSLRCITPTFIFCVSFHIFEANMGGGGGKPQIFLKSVILYSMNSVTKERNACKFPNYVHYT
jgi:hypothetical protein